LPDAKGLEFDLIETTGENIVGHFRTSLIGDYILGTLMGVIEIALKLGFLLQKFKEALTVYNQYLIDWNQF